ncbi:DUF6069 family protein [Actinomadura kijaniata]|uniref:DUF6069 family protein n=1 Tax=Actinomadura kijaniata TaxID=46161 RepID=UPI003F1DC5A9
MSVETAPPPVPSRLRTRALAVAGAVAASLAVWAVGEPLLGHDLVVTAPGRRPMDLGASQILVFSLLPGLLGWALLALLERVTSRAGAVWTVLALLVLALSFAPLASVEATGGSKVVLALTHVAVGAVLVPAFLRTTGARR